MLIGDLSVLIDDLESLICDLDVLICDLDVLIGDLESLIGDLEALIGDLEVLIDDLESFIDDLSVLIGDLLVLVSDLSLVSIGWVKALSLSDRLWGRCASPLFQRLQSQSETKVICRSSVRLAALDNVPSCNSLQISFAIFFSMAAPMKNVCGA